MIIRHKIFTLITLFYLLTFSAFSQFGVKGCYQPYGLPIEVCLDEDYNWEVKSSRSIMTPLGRFKLQGGYSSELRRDYYSYINSAETVSERIRYVEIEKPKFMVYIKYEGEVWAYEIKKNNELRIESLSGINARFRNSIVEIELARGDSTKIVFNSLKVRKLSAETEYPNKKSNLPVAKFDHFKNNFLQDLISRGEIDIYGMISIPKYIYHKVDTSVLNTNIFEEPTWRVIDYYIKGEDGISRIVLSIYEDIFPEEEHIHLCRAELHFNKSTFELIKYYSEKSVGIYKYFGLNIYELSNYLVERQHITKMDSVQDYSTNNKWIQGFSTFKSADCGLEYNIGVYSRNNDDISDLIIIYH